MNVGVTSDSKPPPNERSRDDRNEIAQDAVDLRQAPEGTVKIEGF